MLEQDEIEFEVSDFRYFGNEGISQSKIKDEYLNENLFRLKGGNTEPTKQSTKQSNKVKKPRKLSKSLVLKPLLK